MSAMADNSVAAQVAMRKPRVCFVPTMFGRGFARRAAREMGSASKKIAGGVAEGLAQEAGTESAKKGAKEALGTNAP